MLNIRIEGTKELQAHRQLSPQARRYGVQRPDIEHDANAYGVVHHNIGGLPSPTHVAEIRRHQPITSILGTVLSVQFCITFCHGSKCKMP